MAYTKNALATGATITKTALDNMENGIAAAAERPTSGTPSSTTFFRGDGVWAAPPTSTGGTSTGVPYIMYADSPPSSTNLTAISADNSTNDSARLQAMLNYLKNTYGGGTLVLPPAKTIRITSGLSIPSSVRLVGLDTSVLRYDNSSGTAITINDGSCTPLESFKLIGPATGGGNGINNAGTTTGINIAGARMTFKELEVRGFEKGINCTNSDTYILDFNSCRMGNCNYIFFMDIGGKIVTPAPVNSGERISFTNCLFDNSMTAVYGSGNGTGMFFTNCSIDFCKTFVSMFDGSFNFQGTHLECGGNVGQSYIFKAAAYSHITMTNCEIIISDRSFLMDPTSPPWGVGGTLNVTNTHAWYTKTDGNSTHDWSNLLVEIPPNTTSVTLNSVFLSKWGSVSARMVAAASSHVVNQPANVQVHVSSVDYDAGKATFTLSQAVSDYSYMKVQWS